MMAGPGWTEAQLAAYIEHYVEGRYGRLLNRFFQATVMAVQNAVTASTYNVQLRRTEDDTAVDITWYRCMPGFTPTVGQVVECQWRDDVTAYVMFPVVP